MNKPSIAHMAAKDRKTAKAEVLSLVAPAPRLECAWTRGKIWQSRVENMAAAGFNK